MSESLFVPSDSSIARALASLNPRSSSLNLDLSSYTPPVSNEVKDVSEEKQGLSSSESVPAETPAKPVPAVQDTPTAKVLNFSTPNGCSWADMMESDSDFSDFEPEMPLRKSLPPLPSSTTPPSASVPCQPSSASKVTDSGNKFKASQIATPPVAPQPKKPLSETSKNSRSSPQPFKPAVRPREQKKGLPSFHLEPSPSATVQPQQETRRVSTGFSFADALKQNMTQDKPKPLTASPPAPLEVKPTKKPESINAEALAEKESSKIAVPIEEEKVEKIDLKSSSDDKPVGPIRIGWSWAERVKGQQSAVVASTASPSLPEAEVSVETLKPKLVKAAHVHFEEENAMVAEECVSKPEESVEEVVLAPVPVQETSMNIETPKAKVEQDRSGWSWAERAKGQRIIKPEIAAVAAVTPTPVVAKPDVTPGKEVQTSIATESPKEEVEESSVEVSNDEDCETLAQAPQQASIVKAPPVMVVLHPATKSSNNKKKEPTRHCPVKPRKTAGTEQPKKDEPGVQSVHWTWAPWARPVASKSPTPAAPEAVTVVQPEVQPVEVDPPLTESMMGDESHENGSISTSEATLPSVPEEEEVIPKEVGSTSVPPGVAAPSGPQPVVISTTRCSTGRSWADRTKEVVPATRRPLRGVVQPAPANTPLFREEQIAKTCTLWIGGLGIPHDIAWLKKTFASHHILRVLQRADGYAICEFPSETAPLVIAAFNNTKIDRRKIVVRPSTR